MRIATAFFTVALALQAYAQLPVVVSHSIEVNITVPPFKVDQDDAYLCVSALLPPHPHKLVGVIPHAKQEVVHHILLYGCAEPHMAPKDGKPVAWRCDMQPVCNGPSSTILYGWGRNAPDLRLPEGVGFSVGERTGVKYIVAQVHYLKVRPPNDHSGVTLLLKPHAVPYAAGLVSFASWFTLPPGKKSHPIVNTCCYKGYEPLTMFAVRVHTHALGRRVFMTREKWNKTGTEELVSRDPQLPQSFVPTTRHTIWPGDRLTVTCLFDTSSKTAPVSAGGTHNDEMCNMYTMVYGKTPYLTMCDNNAQDIRDDSPGALPRHSSLVADPMPNWRPPAPAGTPGDALGAEAVGDATSVTTGPDGTLWVLYRATGVWKADTFDRKEVITRKEPVPEAVVLNLHPDTGKILARWGADVFYLPHSISVDQYGNVWVVDVGRHQVLKFDSKGKQLMVVGQDRQPGAGKDKFCKPTQVSVLRDGSFIVADGYCNSRVVWFDKAGKYIAESAAIKAVVHGVLVDECEGLVYVASREGRKVVALDITDTKKRLQLKATYDMAAAGHGQVWALRFGPYGEQLALTWDEGKDAHLVNVRFPTQFWTLPGTAKLSPHDFTLGGAATELSGAGDRFFSVYLASVGVACDTKCGPLHKYVVVPTGFKLPAQWELETKVAVPSKTKDVKPGDAKELPHGAVAANHTANVVAKAIAKGVPAPAKPPAGEEEDEGGAMVADDYEEDVEDDTEDAEDYEAAKKAEEVEVEAEEEVMADYEEMVTGVRPNTTHSKGEPVPLDKERYEVLLQDKKEAAKTMGASGWGIALVVVMAVMMTVTVVYYARGVVMSYIQSVSASSSNPGGGAGIKGGPSAANSVAAGGGLRKTFGAWASAAEGLLGRFSGRGGGAAAAAGLAGTPGATGTKRSTAEVEAARERERLLRSGP
ncbi:hypothetical protein HXX76_004284 [Chlamydomonas incerta]|uniref:Peptidylglycine monooxygenase n=1 Tax=Chlamydomonas incerta TaxID=51695 RepID=A0A835W8R5_CHLIN|nr:hypothetical protein HXX76_004284 [Chlamydomonas incerta]|eukprot:KAG2440171.1 hypothetical protein HXX76_004284 [Chlamydomonas incerta]